MEREEVVRLLVRFFQEGFAEDPSGVGEWIEGQGFDVDEFIGAVDSLMPSECGHVGKKASHFQYKVGSTMHCFQCGKDSHNAYEW